MNKIIGILFLCFALLNFSVEAGYIYIGTEDNFIYQVQFDTNSGALSLVSSTTTQNPSFLAIHPSKQYLYSVNEVDVFGFHDNSGGISAFKINGDGSLSFFNSAPSQGSGPAHISLDSTGKWLGVANYGAGSYGVWKINSDFTISFQPTTFIQDKNHGPDPQQDGPHAHEFVFGRQNTFVVVPDLGNDQWNQYSFNTNTGALTALKSIVAPSGSGPRHFAFHPTLPFAYGASELASTVTVFSAPANLQSGLSVIQRVSSLPANPPQSSVAELQFSPDGKFLYVSNRVVTGNGTIAVFTINQSTGFVSLQGSFDTFGNGPRFFTLSPDGRFVLVANQNSNNIYVFERDQQTGNVGKVVSSLTNVKQPSHIAFL